MTMRLTLSSAEDFFAVFSLLFYSNLLAFSSLFNGSSFNSLGVSAVAISNPLTPLLQALQHGVFLIALLLILLRWKLSLVASLRAPIFWLLVALMMGSFLWSDFPSDTMRKSVALFETITFGVYFGSRFSLGKQLQLLAIASSLIIVTSFLYSVALPGSAIETGGHAGDWRGPFIQKNEFAKVIVLCCISTYLYKSKSALWNITRLAIVSLSALMIVLSDSKTALVVVSFLFLSVYAYRGLYSLIRNRSALLIPSVSLFLVTLLGSSWLLVFNLENIANSAGKNLTLTGRTTIWSAVSYKIAERPLLGYGYLGFWRDIYGGSAYVGKVFNNLYLPKDAHNGFLELALAFGFVGVALFSLSFLHILLRAAALPVPVGVQTAYWPLVYLTFLILYNQTEATLILHNSIFFVLFVALALSDYHQFKKTQSEKLQVKEMQFEEMQLEPIP